MEDNSERINVHLSVAMNQLRANIDNAFNGDSVVFQSDQNASTATIPREDETALKKQLRLTEYLLHIKELRIAEELEDKKKLQSVMLSIARLFALYVEGAAKPKVILDSIADIMQAYTILCENYTADYRVYSANMSPSDIQFFNNASLPELDLSKPDQCISMNNCVIYTRFAAAIIFLRNSMTPFTTEDVKIATELVKILFKTAFK